MVAEYIMCLCLVCHVALNRPSFQVSTMTDAGGNYSADLANDGSRFTQLHTYSGTTHTPHCVHSRAETHPWWSVDLGLPLSVQEIIFTNRDGVGEYRLSSSVHSASPTPVVRRND